MPEFTKRELELLKKAEAYAKIVKDSKVRQKLQDIDLSLNWGQFARHYFSKSASWFYNKFNGIDGNGGEGGFTPEELQQFKGALCDLADRIRRAADTL